MNQYAEMNHVVPQNCQPGSSPTVPEYNAMHWLVFPIWQHPLKGSPHQVFVLIRDNNGCQAILGVKMCVIT